MLCSWCKLARADLVTDTGIAACLPCAARCVADLWRFLHGEPPQQPPAAPPPEPLADAGEALPGKVADVTSRGKY